jgi:hypothetical protein
MASSEDQTAAHFGAFVFGSDVDGRQMRGKGQRILDPRQDPAVIFLTLLCSQGVVQLLVPFAPLNNMECHRD